MDIPAMTPERLEEVGLALYGTVWQARIAGEPELDYSDRQVRRWKAGKHPVPASVAAWLERNYAELLKNIAKKSEK